MADKPIDTIDEASQNGYSEMQAKQTDEQRAEALRVQELFKAAYNSKFALNLPDKWRLFDDYKHNRQIQFAAADDPMSQTNIIHPIVESQIADLVSKPYDVRAKGREASDELYSEQTEDMMRFILDNNKFRTKVNLAEHDRLELGTCIFKVYFDHDALGGKGLPTFEPVSPTNAFPDPKVPATHLIQEGEFFIHAVPRSLSYFRRNYPEWGKYVQRQLTIPYDETFEGADAASTDNITAGQALCIECYRRDEDGQLYRVTVANDILLEDTREEEGPIQRRNMYPFVMIPCYVQRGQVWGMGDVELLIPSQDLINELDDMIRINARMMGNPQIVVGKDAGSGFDFRKWTSKSGLRIPMRDPNAFRVVEARAISPDVVQRREKSFEEADIISGRYNVNRGDTPGKGVTAASAIAMLQQAGQKTVIHKQNIFKEAFAEVLQLLYDEMVMNWKDEMWVRIEGTQSDYKFYDMGQLSQIAQRIPDAMAGMNQDTLKVLADEMGMVMTREAEFDLSISIGDGLPDDKTFIYQSIMDLSKIAIDGVPLITWNEIRRYMRDELGIRLDDDDQAMAQHQAAMMPPMPMMPPGGEPGGGMPL